ncbi:uncharacterized protein LOC107398581 [Tribolium castaneum]|uniref:uncharacterized protein LOC107398581 n=1 Tax=Tribolium castaneum TaxID=7070 RepID=UPI0030FF0006
MNNQKIQISNMTRKVLRYSLLWPKTNEELNPGIEYQFSVLGFFLVTAVHEVDAEVLAILIASYGSYYMICAHLKNQHKVALLMRDLSVFNNFGKPPNFDKRNNQLNFVAKLLALYSFLATIFYNGEQLINKTECKRINKEKGLSDHYCGLLAPCWLPFEIDYFPVFHLILIYAFTSGYLLIKMAIHISYNAFEIVSNIVLRIEHLKAMILETFENRNKQVCHKKFLQCILYHIEILDFAARLDDSFFNSMFGHLALTGGICACLEKQIVSGVNVVAGTLHFIGWILALFIGCVAGQYLINASEILPSAIWTAKWYDADLELKKKVLFMLARSQKSLFIRAGPFGILCYPLFVTVLKTSYSILCMLTS